MIIKKAALYLIIFFLATSSLAQGKFRILDSREESEKVDFSLINNLIIVKAKINGKELSFLLDTGIKKTMLFNLVFSDSLMLNNTEMIQLNGLGEGEPIQAIKSKGNLFEMKGIVNPDMSLFVIVDDLFDLSAKLGVDIHGIIGGDLFEDFVVKINYASERLTFYNPDTYDAAKCKGCESFPLEFYSNKPFINVGIENHLGKEFTVRLLIDSGGGDSLWLFPYSHPDIIVSDNYFDDFLGRGLNGNIFGKKSKIKKIKIGSFEFENASVSYPDSTSMLKMHTNKDRNGTLGAGILKRFIVIMDYPNREITLKKNTKLFREPFLYNKSGIELSYGRDMLVQEKKPRMVQSEDSNTSITQIFFNYGLTYKPSFQIVLIRKGSPAHYAGLMEGDILLEINGVPAFSLEMTEVIHIFSQKDNKKIRVLVDRNGEHLRYMFNLKSLLD
jgi:hypothetical protein